MVGPYQIGILSYEIIGPYHYKPCLALDVKSSKHIPQYHSYLVWMLKDSIIFQTGTLVWVQTLLAP